MTWPEKKADQTAEKQAQNRADRETDLIKLVYTLAVEPQHLHIFLNAIDTELEQLYNEVEAPSETVLLERIDGHVAIAHALLDRQTGGLSQGSITRRAIDMDRQPALMITPDLLVRHANGSALAEIGTRIGEKLTPDFMDRCEFDRFSKLMKSISVGTENRFLGVFEVHLEGGAKLDRMVLSKASDRDGQAVGHLASLRTRWQAHTGEGFGEAFDLSPAERMIVQAIVEGDTLDDVAKVRGTALGTVRNQTKRLLAKLDLHSQTELVCLYAGFSQVSPLPAGLGTSQFPKQSLGGKTNFFVRSDGSALEYEVYGAPKGHPVLFLHPLMGGTGLTTEHRDLVAKYGLRLIMPWLPYYKGTQDLGAQATIKERFASDVLSLLGELNIETIPILAINTSAIYGLEMAIQKPERISKIVIGNAPVPLLTRKQFKQISVQQRMPYYIARHMPRILDFYIKSIKAKLDAGYEVEYISGYYEDSPSDLKTVLEPEVRSIVTQSITFAFEQGHQSVTNHMKMEASNWMPLLENCPVPIEMVSGSLDVEYTPAMVREASAHLNHVDYCEVPEAGKLIWFQKPNALFSRLGT